MSRPELPDEQASALAHWEVTELVMVSGESDVQKDNTTELADAREQAIAAGREAGLQAGRAEIAAEGARLKELADSYANALDKLDFRLADMVLELALDVARQVVAGELAVHPERILDVVKLALNQMAESTREARLLLNPEDAALIRPHLEQILDKNRLRMVEDVRIARGGCLIETTQGDLDATLQARWRNVVQVLGSNKGWIE
ncbi:MAG: FliH/SctL family protein [Thiobacillaceae bacterium]